MEEFVLAMHSVFLNTANLDVPPSIAQTLNIPSWKKLVQSIDSALNIGNLNYEILYLSWFMNAFNTRKMDQPFLTAFGNNIFSLVFSCKSLILILTHFV